MAFPRSRALRLLAALGLAGALLGAAVGWILASRSDSPAQNAPRPAATATVTVGDFRLVLPEGFRRDPDARALPGLAVPGTVGLRGYARINIAQLPPEDESLLPDEIVERLGPDLPEPEAVSAGRLEALHYPRLAGLVEDGRVHLYAVPTTRGTGIIACHGHPAAPYECEILLERLRLLRGRPLEAGPAAGFLQVLPGVVARLDRERRTGRTRLAEATGAAGRADAATGLRASYEEAASALAAVSPLSGPAADTVALLREVGAAYAQLAEASTRRDPATYRTAATAVRGLEGRLERQLAAWRDQLST